MVHTNGSVNKQNAEIPGPQNPGAVEVVPVTSENGMIWYGMHNAKIIGPYFFIKPAVNGDNYK